MKVNIGTKLFLSHLAVLLVGALILVVVAQFSLPGAYGRHLGMMNGAGMMGYGAGRGQAGAGQAVFQNFKNSFFEALGWAGLASLLVALVVSLLISRSIASPIRDLTSASQRVAEGHYHERVPAGEGDEIGKLAGSFNSMAEKLEQVEAMRRRLIGDVAHELRTPLTAIKGSMEGLVDGVLPASAETFGQVAAETERLSRLVDDLQELSRIESGAIKLEPGLVSLSDLFETAQRRVERSFAAKGVTLRINRSDDLPPVQADAGRLLQVLNNLLTNALRFTPRGGKVTLSTTRQKHEISISVADSGVGISAEHLPHIFERFYRADKSRSRQAGEGSGIGLTICKYLVEAHGGRIRAESAGEGKGSSFTFTLPLA
jgi:two-component system sensor histidine kinase BaeS